MLYMSFLTGILVTWGIILGIVLGHRAYRAGLKMGFRLCEALYKGSTGSLADVRPERYEEPAEFGLLDKKEEDRDEESIKV